MMIKMNLKGNFKIVPEGERILTITKAEATPSGKPDKLKVTFQDTEGGTIESRYMFDNDVSIYAMSMLISKALGLGDGEEFDTKRDTEKLIGVKVKCEVVHKNGTKPNDDGVVPVFANIKKVIERVDDYNNDEESNISTSPRNSIIENDDDLD